MKITFLIINFILSILSCVLIPFSGLFMPLFFLLSTSLFILLSVKNSVIYSLFSSAFSVIILYFLSDSVFISTVFPLTSLFSAVGIYFALKLKKDFKTTLLSGTLGYFILIAVIYFIYGGNFIADAIGLLQTIFFESIDTLSASLPSGADVSMISEIKNVYKLFFENLKVLIPSLVLSFIFLLSYFSIKIGSHFAKDKTFFSNLPEFSKTHAPFVILLVGAIAYMGQLSENAFIAGLMSNLFMVISVYYTLCGFSLLDFLIKRKTISLIGRVFIILAIIIALTLLSMFMPFANPVLLAMFAGVMDTVFNYRLRATSAPKNRT